MPFGWRVRVRAILTSQFATREHSALLVSQLPRRLHIEAAATAL
jgi:hypothetical protein